MGRTLALQISLDMRQVIKGQQQHRMLVVTLQPLFCLTYA